MILLALMSLVWAFSFGLIKGRLVGLDSTAVAVVRLALAAVVFLPFWRPAKTNRPQALWLFLIGAIQFGLMYGLYLRAFALLKAHEVALFTIFTPIYVALLGAALEKGFTPRHLWAAALSVLGAGVVLWGGVGSPEFVGGFLLVQASNLCFAVGQLAYRRTRERMTGARDHEVFALLYLGGVVAMLLVSAVTTDWTTFRPTPSQWGVLAYLGVLASGVGFFLWNLGATQVNTGVLAAWNNAKVPLGVACSLVFFGERADPVRLVVSLGLLGAAIWLAGRPTKPATPVATAKTVG